MSSYYGLGRPVDYTEARRCALLERAHIPTDDPPPISPDDDPDSLDISGSTMLAMIYANGNGVAPNKALAMRFACEALANGTIEDQTYDPDAAQSNDAPSQALLRDIAATAAKPAPSLDICTYLPDQSRLLTTCDLIERQREDLQRRAQIESFAASFTPAQKAAYGRLVSSFEAYMEAHDNKETSVMGHYPFSAKWERQPQQELDFIETMRGFERGGHPSHTAAEYAAADRALNAKYRQTMEAAQHPDPNSDENPPSAQDLRDTERLWLIYRDAWVTFGRLRYPQVSGDSWLTWSTLHRIEDLSGFGEVIP